MPPPYSVDDDTSRSAAFAPRPPRPVGIAALPSRPVGIPTAPMTTPSPHATHALIPDPNTQPKPQPMIGHTPSFMPRPQGYGPTGVGVAPAQAAPTPVGIRAPAQAMIPAPNDGFPAGLGDTIRHVGQDPSAFTWNGGALSSRQAPAPGQVASPQELDLYDRVRATLPGDQIGLPARPQAQPQVGVQQAQAPAGDRQAAWSAYPWSHQQRRNDAMQRIAEDFQRAQQSGDRQAMVELSGERAALDRGGFEAQAEYAQTAAKAKAERDSLAIRSRSEESNQDLSRAQAESLRGKMTNDQSVWNDPTKAWVATFNETHGDRGAADAVEQRIRAGMPGGQANPQDPNQAASILQRNPSIAAMFPGGGKPLGDLPDIYSKLKAIAPPGWDDPGSELGQAIATSLRGGYGEDLESQLQPPMVDPSQGGEIMRLMDTELYGNLARAVQWIPPIRIGNQAIFGEADPFHSYQRQRAAADWYKHISANPNQPR